jgi:hypothetical protein
MACGSTGRCARSLDGNFYLTATPSGVKARSTVPPSSRGMRSRMMLAPYLHLGEVAMGGPPMSRHTIEGFCILFAFIGTFTYVNFVLVRPPLSLGMMQLGFVYFVFLPIDRDNSAGRSGGATFRNATDPMGIAGTRRCRAAARAVRPCCSAWFRSPPARSLRKRPQPAS